MAFRSITSGRVYVLRWLTSPESGDLKTLGREMVDFHRRVGEQIINLSLIPDELSPPDAAVRKEMEAFNQIWMELCSSIHVVVGGSGFKHAVLRSIVSAFALASRKRGLVQVHRTLEDALAEIHRHDQSVVSLRGQLATAGVLDGLNK